jgi:hypothetical protein
MKSSMEISSKTKNRHTTGSIDITPGHILKGCKPGYNRATCTSTIIVALFKIVNIWKQPRCLTIVK